MKKSLVALVMAGCMLVPSMTTFASAADSSLPSNFISWNRSADTNKRAKENDSYHYIYNRSSMPLWVQSRSASGVNCTKNDHAIIPSGRERFITNYVYEWGHRSCFLRIYAGAEKASGILKGVWSPDSVGSYTVANP